MTPTSPTSPTSPTQRPGKAEIETDAALQKAGEDWLECVNAIIARTAEFGEPWSHDRAASLIAILTGAGYFTIKISDLADDGITPKICAAKISGLSTRLIAAEEVVKAARMLTSRTINSPEQWEECLKLPAERILPGEPTITARFCDFKATREALAAFDATDTEGGK